MLKTVARRDVEHRKPPPQEQARDSRQPLLTAEIDHMQAAARLEVSGGRAENAAPVGDHRKTIGNHHMVEPGDAEQSLRVKRGRIAMRDANATGEAGTRNGR